MKLLTAASVVTLISVSAQAADLPVAPMEEAPAYVPAYDWSGLYVGVHAGYGWGESEFEADKVCKKDSRQCTPKDDDWHRDGSMDVDGFLAGGQVGYNAQFGSFVVGAKADISWSGMDGDVDFLRKDDGKTFAELHQEIDWLATVRGRAGVTFDRFLVYATGGVAFADVETELARKDDNGDTYSVSNTRVGWTVGGGVEAFITPNVTARLEYLYVNLGDEDHDFNNGNNAVFSGSSDLDAHVVRGALNYKFDW